MTARCASTFECDACREDGADVPRVVIEVNYGTLFSARCPVCKEPMRLLAHTTTAPPAPPDAATL